MSDPHPLVCRFGALGDMVLLTPMLRLLYHRSGLPCDVVGIGGINRMLFAELPYVRNVYTIDSRSAPYWFNRSQRELVQHLRTQRYANVWICETNRKSYRLLERAGITRDNSINQLDLPAKPGEHYCDKWLRLGNLGPAGFDFDPLPQEPPGTELRVSGAEVDACRQWLAQLGIDPESPLICLQAGSKRTTRRGRADRASNSKYWHERNWAELIGRMQATLPNASVLLCGVPAESDMCDAILAHCDNPQRVYNLANDLPLRRLLSLLSLAHSCISVDTGPAHIAAALDCPLVVLFGKASPARFRPVSRHAAVQVIQGFADGDDEPDISHISPTSVFEHWIELQG